MVCNDTKDALKWAKIFYQDGNFKMIEIEVDVRALSDMYYCQHLDNIGQAFCSRLDVLNKLFDSVKEVLRFMYYKAIVKWISKQNGGRVSPPPEGTRYCPLIKIDNYAEDTYWSIDFVCTKLNKDTMFIEFTSLSEEAPASSFIDQ